MTAPRQRRAAPAMMYQLAAALAFALTQGAATPRSSARSRRLGGRAHLLAVERERRAAIRVPAATVM